MVQLSTGSTLHLNLARCRFSCTVVFAIAIFSFHIREYRIVTFLIVCPSGPVVSVVSAIVCSVIAAL
jgi:hypothetical protein